ncbi:MAG: hypothetical protein KJI69_05710 [Patescibacteria group bacterium]|nr:hypothetical protein [Patescibacteria group bacterium]
MGNESLVDLANLEHDPTALAKKVKEQPVSDNPETFEDTNFVVGDSPVILDCNAALDRNATEFSIQNDGAGDFTVAISSDGVIFGDEKTVKNSEVYAIDNISVDSIRITHIANSAYRVTVL